ncbi:MAG TPA: hypothetical protein VFL57_22140 [Bryobacteraceae bacterium]|nr:hypothetical protein [Bryobacteraceae bacterium]
MANITIGFAIALIILGAAGYAGTAAHSPTALIPALFGAVLLALGAMARNPSRRKLAMHIAVAVGVLGFAGSLRGLMKLPALIAGEAVERPAAVIAQSVMAVLTGVFVALCVKSFIDARRTRPAAGV